MSCKLSPEETVRMKCEILFAEKTTIKTLDYTTILSFAEIAQRVLKANIISSDKVIIA